ncbi:MAG: hypothetical protein KJ968_00955 [Nanoarchaeota archaeon]|nr:hypothetical protein [Nanoarchaeota archaeon]
MVEKETKKSDLTDNFSKFKSEFEPIFGKLEVLAEKAPDVYAHLVLSHGFMDHVSVTGLDEDVISRIKTEQGSFIPQNPNHDRLYWQYLKEEYLTWARQKKLPEELLKSGWEEYRND